MKTMHAAQIIKILIILIKVYYVCTCKMASYDLSMVCSCELSAATSSSFSLLNWSLSSLTRTRSTCVTSVYIEGAIQELNLEKLLKKERDYNYINVSMKAKFRKVTKKRKELLIMSAWRLNLEKLLKKERDY